MSPIHASSCAAALAGAALAAGPADVIVTDQVPGIFIDISATGLALDLADDGVVEIDPGFDLLGTLFAGDGTGRIWVSNNGAIGFLGDGGADGAFFLNAHLPSFALFGGAQGTPQALAPYWDDLDDDTGNVYVQTIGAPGDRILIVQWQDRPHYPGDAVLDGDEVTFQVQLYESACPCRARFVYADVTHDDPLLDGGGSATIGYQGGPAGASDEWSYNAPNAVTDGTSLCIVEAGELCVPDVDLDGAIGFSDLLRILSSWGPCPCCPEELDGDNDVGFSDLLVVLSAWGGCE